MQTIPHSSVKCISSNSSTIIQQFQKIRLKLNLKTDKLTILTGTLIHVRKSKAS